MLVSRPSKRRWSAIETARNVGTGLWQNRGLLRSVFNTWKSYRKPKIGRPMSRPADTPGLRGRAYSRGGSGTSGFKRAFNKMGAFRSVPSVNSTHLDLHSSMSFVLRAPGQSSDDSFLHFVCPLEISHIEPFAHPSFLMVDPLSVRSAATPSDVKARGYPCNQLLGYYNNFVVKNVEMKVDVRLVERVPGGAGIVEDKEWYQSGQVTIPVNVALVRVTASELEYLVNQLPSKLKNVTNDESFTGEQLSNYDRVLREQFGVVPLNMGAHRKEGVVSTKWSAAVADSCKASDIVEGISDNYSDTPENGHIGVTQPPPNATKVLRVPSDPHYIVLLAWLNPTSLGEYLTGRPNERELEVVMDCHLRQYISLGDIVETSAGISSGEKVISRDITEDFVPVQPPGLKKAKV